MTTFGGHTLVCRPPLRIAITAALMAAVAVASFGGGGRENSKIDAVFFFTEICTACGSYKSAGELADLLSSASGNYKHVTVAAYNIALPKYAAKLSEIIEKRGLPDISYMSTVLVVNKIYFVGYEDIEAAVKEICDTGSLARLNIDEE